MKRYAVCITDDDGGTGEAVFTVKNKTEARARGRLYIRQSLNGSKAYRLGELSEKSGATGSILADICAMLNINQELLVAAVKSMQRKERHNGRWDNPNYTCWMNEDDKKRLARFLSNERGESGVYPWFSSTGRKKPWCE